MDRITSKQIKALWGFSGRACIPERELRGWVTRRTGKRSIRALTKAEASRLIGELIDVETGQPKRLSEDRMTEAQATWIRVLGEMIGWDGHRLSGLCKKMYRGKGMRSLNRKEASGLIEALKAIGERVPGIRVA
ncbi:MAG: phage protein GemA/Gp16 family protein [Nitrospira sp.]|nr:DUF1018 domain-containing protein [Candidatus Manganitrophaceae bacterium]